MHIHVFSRQCNPWSKPRPSWFDYKAAFKNLVATIDEDCSLTVYFDGKPRDGHHVNDFDGPIVEGTHGYEFGALCGLVTHIASSDLADDDVAYIVEDDHVHRPGWPDVMREAFEAGIADYVSLYDHPDKYDSKVHPDLSSKIYVTKSCHWRTVPSTVSTWATRVGTIRKHLNVYRAFVDGTGHNMDHERFLHLWKHGSSLATCIPAWDTHAEPGCISPCVDWEDAIRKSALM
jgi:hypothetical protein